MLKLPPRWRNLSDARKAVRSQLHKRFSLRLRSFLLFLFTLVCAYLTAKTSYALGLTSLAPRYLLTCSVGYLAFLYGVHTWVNYVNSNSGDSRDDAYVTNNHDADSSNDIADGIELGGDALSDGPGCFMGIAIAIAVAAGVWLLSLIGSEFLIDMALEALLAGTLVRALKVGRKPNWFYRIIVKTFWVYLAVMASALLFAHVTHQKYPQATTTREVIQSMN